MTINPQSGTLGTLFVSAIALATLASSGALPEPGLAARQNATSLESCLASAGVDTSVASSANWTAETEAWNARIQPVPAAVVFPRTEGQVTAAIRCAAQAGTAVTTLGGRRSFSSMGYGRDNGAVVLDLQHLSAMAYDDGSRVFTYGGAVTVGEAVAFMWEKHGRALPHVRCPDVGMTGSSLGGGMNTRNRAHGTVLDNLVSARVALADGSVVDAGPAGEHSDLFWGVKGAPNSLGVVLALGLRTIDPVPRVINFTVRFSPNAPSPPTLDDNVQALLGLQAWALDPNGDDDLAMRFYPSNSSYFDGFYYGGPANFQRAIAAVLRRLPPTMQTLARSELDFWASEQAVTPPGIYPGATTPRRYFYITSLVVPAAAPLTNASAHALFVHTAYADQPDAEAMAGGSIDIWGGSAARRVTRDTGGAWSHGDANGGNLLLIRWDLRTNAGAGAAFAPATLDRVRAEFYRFVVAYKAEGGRPAGFPNYRDSVWDVGQTAEFLYGANWERLRTVKARYDPGGLFNTDPQAVPAPAAK